MIEQKMAHICAVHFSTICFGSPITFYVLIAPAHIARKYLYNVLECVICFLDGHVLERTSFQKQQRKIFGVIQSQEYDRP